MKLSEVMKPDLIVCWPRNCDYPLWRSFIKRHRNLFNVVIIVFTETHQGEDYREFIKESLLQDWVLCVNSPVPSSGEDWRNVAINHGLLQSYNAEWVLFTEQDFFPLDGFFSEVGRLVDEGAQAIGVKVGERLHPCCLFLKREVLNKTRKDFGIIPDKADHFARITQDIEAQGIDVKLVDDSLWEHMNGLSHNLRLISEGEQPNWGANDFNNYLVDCLRTDVALDWRFKALVTSYLERIGYLG